MLFGSIRGGYDNALYKSTFTYLLYLLYLPVQRQVEFKIACLVHQSLASLAPTYLTTNIHLVSEYGRRSLRSSTDRTLTVPRTHNRFDDRSIAVAGPRLWNSLPISLRQISSFGQFRWYLKNHLFGIWEITAVSAQCDVWFFALYKYSYLPTYLLLLSIILAMIGWPACICCVGGMRTSTRGWLLTWSKWTYTWHVGFLTCSHSFKRYQTC